MVVLRRTIGDVLRDERRGQQRTLREVSSTARVSLGYLSEVERGQKEASSELLASICTALDVPLSHVLGEVTRRIADEEGGHRPYAAEGVVPAPGSPRTSPKGAGGVATAARLPRVEPAPAVPAPQPARPVLEETPEASTATGEHVDAVVDQAVDALVDSALEELVAGRGSEFPLELDGLPEELELVLRRRLLPAA